MSQSGFHSFHLASISLVIISQKVQNAMKHEDANFFWDGTAKGFAVATRDGGGNGDVAQMYAAELSGAGAEAARPGARL